MLPSGTRLTLASTEHGRRKIYDSMADVTQNEGIDLEHFYNNPSYFGTNDLGAKIAWTGSHQALIHWPLVDYRGGSALVDEIIGLTRHVNAIASSGFIRWVQPQYWHSTVFSPVHSGDPKVIEQSPRDISALVCREILHTKRYSLKFTRIIITHDGGVLAVAYGDNDELDGLRARLKSSMPIGHASPIVHITLGHFTRMPAPTTVSCLTEFAGRFRGDMLVIGEIQIDFLTLGMYHAPFLEMTVEEIFRRRLGED